MKIKDIHQEIELPEGVEARSDKSTLTLKGKLGEVSREFKDARIDMKVEGNKVIIEAKNATKRQKTRIGTFKAHIKNMAKGALGGHTYTLKICSGHFPMNVSVKGKEFTVKNFIGEKVPRVLKLRDDVDVKVNGTEIKITSISKESAGQAAADIETLTKITDKDRRIFQDGIYITNKDGKDI